MGCRTTARAGSLEGMRDKPAELEQKVQCSDNQIDSAFFVNEVNRFGYKGQLDLPDSSFTCVWSVIQFTSQVLPPSSEKDCSKWGVSVVVFVQS